MRESGLLWESLDDELGLNAQVWKFKEYSSPGKLTHAQFERAEWVGYTKGELHVPSWRLTCVTNAFWIVHLRFQRTLPPEIVEQLKLSWREIARIKLADRMSACSASRDALTQ